ncbi:MAG: UDP-3-O-[3-hydroxymyristoyl] N-acetylglucosamine deacetylase [Phycisphaerales bacterium]|nr:MAG: UDP-3-O-[3-hydroxymyristoyl] N-acetylglucosamine deacetylase [Phycisphaerales bacterium]
MSAQQTISKPVELSGRGLFTGEPVTVRFRPAPPNTGIIFIRTDQGGPVRVPALVDNVTKRARRTSLRNGTVAIETVEHCLSACAGLGVDNIEAELNGCELPALDGSCQEFVDCLTEAGLTEQSADRKCFRINQPVRVADGEAELVAFPGAEDRLRIIYELDYAQYQAIGHQMLRVDLSPETYRTEIAPSRTFLLREEAEQFRAAGLGQHLTYQDILVFGDDGPIDNPLRFKDECVRHKILDLIGDLVLLGRFVFGTVYARKSGHALNHELIRKLRDQVEAEELARRSSEPVLDIRRIQRTLPHRYPFLLIDRILQMEGTKRAVGIKNVTINEEFFQGHYPGQPIMPGVLIIEAMAQLAGILLSQELEHKGKIAVLLSMDRARFRRPVVPGDQLVLEAVSLRVKSRTGHVRCSARVGDTLVAEATIKFMLVDADPV